MSELGQNALLNLIDWCADNLERHVRAYLDGAASPGLSVPPDHPDWPGRPEEQVVIGLALLRAFAPEKLDLLSLSNPAYGRPYTVFGATQDADGIVWPTLRTAGFLLSGEDDRPGSLKALALASPRSRLVTENWISLSQTTASERLSARLMPGPALDHLFDAHERPLVTGAHVLTTGLEPGDLIVPSAVRNGLEELKRWLAHGSTVYHDWGLARLASPGYRTLFHGPPGTGKTLAATLLGKETDRQVFRIDLAQMVSKYIGETEKNLAAIFDAAADLDAILFFDEADALFGKRTEARSSNDRYANQEVSYLLQRIEEVSGLTILASNLKSNIDQAFQRRFQSVIYFPMPGMAERLAIWRGYLADVPKAEPLDLERLSAVDVTGATIANSILAAALAARAEGLEGVNMAVLDQALNRERRKQGQGAGT